MHGFISILLLQLATYSILTQLKCFQSSNIANDCLISSPDPTYERGSGDIRLIPWASLLSREKYLSPPITLQKTQSVQCNTGNS